MSTVHLVPTLRANAADQQSTVQKLLDENSRLIDIIKEYQNQSRADEAIKHQQLLHRNLVHLSNLADPYLLPQLKDDVISNGDANQTHPSPQNHPAPPAPPMHPLQPPSTQHPQQNHHSQPPPSHNHQGQMMPPQAVPSPNGPGGSMQPPHGFAPPPLGGPQEMMNHQAYQAQMRAQQQQQQNGPPQGYPPFGQPAPQMGGQRMPYPYPPQGMPGYPGGPPSHGYEGYPPPGGQPPQGYMR